MNGPLVIQLVDDVSEDSNESLIGAMVNDEAE